MISNASSARLAMLTKITSVSRPAQRASIKTAKIDAKPVTRIALIVSKCQNGDTLSEPN